MKTFFYIIMHILTLSQYNNVATNYTISTHSITDNPPITLQYNNVATNYTISTHSITDNPPITLQYNNVATNYTISTHSITDNPPITLQYNNVATNYTISTHSITDNPPITPHDIRTDNCASPLGIGALRLIMQEKQSPRCTKEAT